MHIITGNVFSVSLTHHANMTILMKSGRKSFKMNANENLEGKP